MKSVVNASNAVKIMIVVTSLGALSSCSDVAGGIKGDAAQTITANSTAQSHIEWEGSKYSPQVTMQKYRTEYEIKKMISDTAAQAYGREVCKGFSQISDQSLVLFDNEINHIQNDHLFETCKKPLVARINKYFTEDRKNLKYSVDATSSKPSNINFKLNMVVDNNLDLNNFDNRLAGLKDYEVVLTFDDGPHAMYTDSILRTLQEAGDIKAMFFALGQNIIRNKSQAQKEYKSGHVVANHSWSHFCMKDSDRCEKKNKASFTNVPRLDNSYVIAEIEKTYKAIHEVVGEVAPFMRFPFGEENDASIPYLKNRGVFRLGWSIDSNDWRGVQELAGQNVPYTNSDMIKSTINAIEAQKKGVVLFHDIHRRSAESLPQFLYELYKRNYKVILLRAPGISVVNPNQEMIKPNLRK